MNVKELIPKNKKDNNNISKLYNLTDKEIKPIIYDLLEWIQDYNRPVAQDLIPVLIKREDLVFPYIKDILNGSDPMWKYWVMDLLIPHFSDEHKIILKNDIIKLINNPKKDEDSEAVREIAIECYDRCNFDD